MNTLLIFIGHPQMGRERAVTSQWWGHESTTKKYSIAKYQIGIVIEEFQKMDPHFRLSVYFLGKLTNDIDHTM
jgi:hypothetical protein